jgi:hypothetical protein
MCSDVHFWKRGDKFVGYFSGSSRDEGGGCGCAGDTDDVIEAMESTTSPLKKSSNMDLSCIYCGCVSKSSEAKCISGLWPGIDFGVCYARIEVDKGRFIHASPAHPYHIEYPAVVDSYECKAVWSLLVVIPTTKNDASFLDVQNSREDIEVVAESNRLHLVVLGTSAT